MILVTGSTGLVGSHLVLHLAENANLPVRAIYRDESQIEGVKSLFASYGKIELFAAISWVNADILDISSLEIAFKDITKVYHCAGQISFDPNDENLLRKTNIEGTANIVNFCIDKNVVKLCHVSSIAALGTLSPGQSEIDETSGWNPDLHHSDYALSKYGAEMEVWRGQQEGLQVVIVNPGIILGPHVKSRNSKQGSSAFVHRIKRGMPFYTNGITGYVGVWDVVKIMRALMESSIHGERFIVVAENRTFEDIISTIAAAFHRKPPQFNAKKWMLLAFWRLDQLCEILLRTKRKITRVGILSLYNKDRIANTKVKNALSYEFESIDSYIQSIITTY